MTSLESSELRTRISSVWSCSCNASIRDILISQDGVVAVATDSEVHLYAGAPSFGDSHILTLTPTPLTAYRFSTDGSHFLTGDANGFVKWWDVVNGEETSSTQFPYTKADDETDNAMIPISAIRCSKESELVAAVAGSTICIYGHGGLLLHSIGPLESTVQSIEWNTDKELAVNTGSAVCMISVTPEQFLLGHRYPGELKEGVLSSLSCSPDGEMLAGGCSEGVVRIWDLASDQDGQISVFVKDFPNSGSGASVQCLAWDSTSHYLAAAGDNDVIVWDMQEANCDLEKDTSIVCYGHGQKAKITSLKFQPNGRLLATGGDDCQVLIFDSGSFNSHGVVSGLVGCILSGQVSNSDQPEASITALAWHPLGLILAGTSYGFVDAFEVSENALEAVNTKSGRHRMQQRTPFLISNASRNATFHQTAGWGGEPLFTNKNENQTSGKFIRRPRMNGNLNSGGGYIKVSNEGRRPGVYRGKLRPPPTRTYTEQTNQGPPSMIQQPMMQWSGYPQHLGPFMGPYPPPSPPERTNSEPNGQIGGPKGAPMGPHQIPPPGYSMGYLPYPPGYPMGYPPAPLGYYPMAPGAPMTGPPPPSGEPHGIQSLGRTFQSMSVGHGSPEGPQKTPRTRPEVSTGQESAELDEELGSKSSEATNNGVTPGSSPTDGDGRPSQGQTLYVGNLASGVDEALLMHYFTPYGPVVNIQVIRDRDTRLSRGYAFVTYAHPFYARTAMQHMDSVQIPGPFEARRLKVSFSNRR